MNNLPRIVRITVKLITPKTLLIFSTLAGLIWQNAFAQSQQKIKFHKLPEGISNNWVTSIMQDKRGFMWFGTANGLSRFDGYSFTHYDHPLIIQRRIYKVFEDHSGKFWICTDGIGLYRYDPLQNTFDTYQLVKNGTSIPSDVVTNIIEDQEGILWLATNNGLFSLNPQNGKIRNYKIPSQVGNVGVYGLMEESETYLWLSTAQRGIARFNKKTGSFTFFTQKNAGLKENFIPVFIPSNQKNKYWIGYKNSGIALATIQQGQFRIEKHYAHDPQNPQSLSGNTTLSLLEDQKNRLWVGVENAGLSILDIQTGTFSNYRHNKDEEFSLSHNSPWSLSEDSFGNVWIGTFSQGVSVVYNKFYEKFEHYQQKGGQSNSLVNNNVSNFWEASDGKIWITTDGGGLSLWDREKALFTNYTAEDNPPLKLSKNALLSICKDPQGNSWFSTWEGGINVFNPSTQSFSLINRENHGLSSNTHFSILKGRDNLMYLSSWENVLEVFDPIRLKVLWSKSLLQDGISYISQILEDRQENLWIASSTGLALISKENRHPNGKVKVFMHAQNQANSLSDNNIQDIFEDSRGNIWIGTVRGLNRYRPESHDFKTYYKNNDMPGDNVKGITEDLQGFLWFITDKGLIRLDTRQNSFTTYRKEDGLAVDAASRATIYRTRKGEILVGGANGFNIFDPSKLPKNPFRPRVFFTDFKIFNKSVSVNTKDSPLKQHIEFTRELILKHTQSMFTIEFVAINYIRSSKNEYAYFMEGLDHEWNYVGNKREANYTGLPAGTYTFKVKAANNDGIWGDEEAVLQIIILPPWWETWWFRLTVFVVIISVSIFGVRWRIQMIKAQNIRLEMLVQERTYELQEKNDEILQQAEELHQQAEELHQQAEALKKQRDFIQTQNTLLSEQNKIVEQKSQRIRQSIHAAQTIQEAILPHKVKLDTLIKNYFLIYRPKDVVSGDFYWLTKVENTTVIVVADCTGHGVPGAFMTLIGCTLLDKIVKISKITQPDRILNCLHEDVYNILKQKHTLNNNGMDAVVISITPLNDCLHKICFSGAKNPVFYLDNLQKSDIVEIRGARRGIGGYQNTKIQFENHEFELSKGSFLYLGSDGFVDQNNVKRKKFGSERFKKLIRLCANLPIQEQQKYFEKALDDYSKDTLQRDDILLIGLQV